MSYKIAPNVYRKHQEFIEGDFGMVHVYLEHYPKHVVKKLNAKSQVLFKIVRKLGSNAYLLDLLLTLSISHVFNIANLYPYHDTFTHPIGPSSTLHSLTRIPHPYTIALIPTDIILDFINNESFSSPI